MLMPLVHGVSESHYEEFLHFRISWWIDQFTANRFEVIETAPLFLHSAYRLFPYRALALREGLSRAGLSSVMAYWLKKEPAYLDGST